MNPTASPDRIRTDGTRRNGNDPRLRMGAVILTLIFALPAFAGERSYSGTNAEMVHKLLSRVDGWACPSNPGGAATPPRVEVGSCQRDMYVAAAVSYAWAAECYARQEEDSKAADNAKKMMAELRKAEALCGGGNGGDCETESIYKCGEGR